jgi:hypothetical protein
LAAAVAAVVFTSSSPASERPVPPTLRGTPIEPSVEMRRQLGPVHRDADVYRLAQIGDRVFYRVESKRDGTCYSAGEAQRFGVILCPGVAAPPPEVVDLSLIEVDPRTNQERVVRLEGVVAGDARAVRLLDDNGNTIVETPVIGHAFHTTAVPARPAVALGIFDASGRELHRIDYTGRG